MALSLLLQQRSSKNAKPGKGENFGCKFKATFLLESSTVKPFGQLSGQLVVESPAPISHYGIRIQYEALCTLKFESKLDNRVRYHMKVGNLLEGGESNEMVDGYLESPVMIDLEPIIKAESSETRPYELQAGTNTYGFTVSIPGEMLPAPFKNSYGSLIYKLSAYMLSETGVLVQIGEKSLKFGGFYNLLSNANISKGILLERSVKKSMFKGKKVVSVKLKLDNRGFLPEEQLRFQMSIINPKCLPCKVSVSLLQKVIYAVNSNKKTTVATVGTAEKDIAEPVPETLWEGTLKIHKLASPTYSGKNPMYTVSHLVQFKIKLDDYNVIKAEHVVYIGTTKETVEALRASISNFSMEEATSSNKLFERRSSISSLMSSSSVNGNISSTVKRAPLYSQLSSSSRMSSIEVPSGCDDNVFSPSVKNNGATSEIRTARARNAPDQNMNATPAPLAKEEQTSN